VAILLPALLAVGCAPQEPATTTTKTTMAAVKKMPAGQDNSGFLKDYSKLQSHPTVEGAKTYAHPDEMKGLRRYVAMVVDPVQLYVATDADPSSLPEEGAAAVAEYFQYAITDAVAEAFPIVDEPGPLVLRLRSALVGVDVGGEVAAGEMPDETAKPLAQAINIGGVIVEFELVDSVSGEVIAAAVDEATLGSGAQIGATHFSRMERFEAAKEAFDEWAGRLRDFLDAEHEIEGGADEERVSKSYRPYSE
jgi:hypothetical protein